MADHPLDLAIGELGAALVQASPRDDQIIIGHIRDAHALLRALRREGKTVRRLAALQRRRQRRAVPSTVCEEMKK